MTRIPKSPEPTDVQELPPIQHSGHLRPALTVSPKEVGDEISDLRSREAVEFVPPRGESIRLLCILDDITFEAIYEWKLEKALRA